MNFGIFAPPQFCGVLLKGGCATRHTRGRTWAQWKIEVCSQPLWEIHKRFEISGVVHLFFIFLKICMHVLLNNLYLECCSYSID